MTMGRAEWQEPTWPNKICAQCGAEKHHTKFWSSGIGSHRRYCKVCDTERQKKRRETYRDRNYLKQRERARRWREAHPELFKKRIEEWRAKNPNYGRENARKRRERKKKNGIFRVTKKDLLRLLRRQRHCCYQCGTDLRKTRKQIDHIIPISLGGVHSIGNIAWACYKCNRHKHDRLLVEVRNAIPRRYPNFEQSCAK